MNWKKGIFVYVFAVFLLGLVGGFSQIQNGPTFLGEVTANADTVNQAEGVDGTCQWYLTQDGVLHIGAGKLAETASKLETMDASQIGYVIAQSLPGESGEPTDKEAMAAAMLVKRVVLDGKVQAPVNSAYLFAQMGNVTGFDNLSDLDTSQTTDMSHMFCNNFSSTGTDVLTTLDLSSFNTAKVTNMELMFYGLGLYHIDLSSFVTSKVTSMMSMFNHDSNLQTVNLSSFDGSSFEGQATYFMFYNDKSLKKIVLGPKMVFDADSPYLNSMSSDRTTYTGKWQAVGTGSDRNPLGTKFDSSTDIVNLYKGSSRPSEIETYVWEPVTRQTRVTAKYVNESGKQIADDAATTYGVIGENNPGYTTKQLAIKGYTFDKVVGDASGAYPNIDTTVTYVYKKSAVATSATGSNTALVAEPVTVQFMDENGQKLAASETLTGSCGATYQASQRSLKGYTLMKDSGNTTGEFTTEPQIVTYIYRRVQPLKASRGYTVVSPVKTIGLYRTKNFKAKRRIHWYLQKPRTKWPMFIVTSESISNQGHLRYHVRDVNHGSKTFGKTGYITAKAQYVVSTYYERVPQTVKVLRTSGLNSYRQAGLKKRVHHSRSKQVLKVKKLVHYHRTTRFQLTNGQYVSANKKLVKAIK
ncbi:MucBP domain-containing protein [Levilactobacillus angrenensis]|uniref:MucBP domain-containing protein n=1 Tax=Levilactobacillus angrenensis TaxID=2486020 RepID=A0ABW1U7U5_9LACO|nr:MucBP domain-containing protein [Levilactobacillus angrenensis]